MEALVWETAEELDKEMALNLADELRELFTNVPYKNIEEVIRETRSC